MHASVMLPRPHTEASPVAMVTSPLMVWKTNIWCNALESFNAGFCPHWIVPVEPLLHFNPAGFLEHSKNKTEV